jgi:hypothetical protein
MVDGRVFEWSDGLWASCSHGWGRRERRIAAWGGWWRRIVGTLRRNAALLLFPIISVLVVGVVSLVLLARFGMQLIRDAEAGTEPGQIGPFTIALLVICLIADAFVVVFFNGALMSEALVVVRGGHASVGHGLAVAARRTPQILAWGLVTATVGLVLSALRDKGGIGVVVFGGVVLAIALVVLGSAAQNVAVTVPAIIGAVLVFGIVAVVSSALGAMVSAVVYVYAVDHTTPPEVSGAVLQSGFAAR